MQVTKIQANFKGNWMSSQGPQCTDEKMLALCNLYIHSFAKMPPQKSLFFLKRPLFLIKKNKTKHLFFLI